MKKNVITRKKKCFCKFQIMFLVYKNVTFEAELKEVSFFNDIQRNARV